MATHCLHIGINDYQGDENDLAGCVNDARDLGRLFGRRRRGAVRDAVDGCRYFGSADTQTTLVDRQATRTRILQEAVAVLQRCERGDWAVITYSGHGTYVPDKSGDEADGHDEAIVCYGLDLIVDDSFAELVERRPPGVRVLWLSDSCNSGTNVRTFGPRLLGPTDPNGRHRFLPPHRIPRAKLHAHKAPAMARAAKLVDVLPMAACRDNQFAADANFGGKPNGAYTHFAIEALCELPAGATFGDWRDAIAEKLPNDEYAQEPQLNAFARALNWKIPATR